MNDVSRWLADLGLEQYAEAFSENAVDGDTLLDLSEADLKELGVRALGHRKKILAAIASFGQTPQPIRKPDGGSEQAFEAKTAAERRNLTVMFIDLVGSTALSGQLDPEEMRDVLRAYQNAVAGEVTRLDGHVAKYMGDGVLAYFGWPRAHEDEAERSVRAGLAITSAVAKLAGGGRPLSCRVGIATGLVVVGDLVGEGFAQEEAVVGDTPNLASRLQAVANPGAVVIAESTRRLVGDFFEFEDLGPQTLKGIEATGHAFAVLRERALESRFAARAGTAMQPIVGREQELALLIERWRQAENGEGQMVLLTGEAGIGKSRIAEALIAALASTPHVNLRYQCSPYHSDSALWPVSQQLVFAAKILPEDSLETRLDKVESLLVPEGAVPREIAALFAILLGLDSEARYGALDLTPAQRRDRTLDALIGQLVGLAARQPVLFILEDAHWIDPTTLEMVELALDRVGQARVLMLLTARPTFSHGFGGHPIVTRLALNRLGRAQTTAIIERITNGKALPESLVDEIAARTDGVPLYVEEMTKAVLESGSLRETPNAWQLDAPLTQVAIPTSLHDSLMARLDRLKPVKEVAQTAAVIGRSFDHRTIASLSSLPEAELIVAMNRLVEAELVFRRGVAPEATYLFKHALVRDAAYESLLKSRRQALHERLFYILKEQSNVQPEILAQHAEAAGLVEAALDCWEQAAGQAVARPAYKEAIAHCEAAIRLCGQIGDERSRQQREARLQLQLGQALLARLGYQAPAAMAAFERARDLAEGIEEFPVLMPAIWGLWANRYISGVDSTNLAVRLGELTVLREDSGSRCVALRMLALEHFHAARYESSLELVGQALAIYNPISHRDLALRFGHDPRSAATSYKAWNLWHLGFPDQARRVAEESLSWAREIGHQNTIGIALCFGPTLTAIWLRDVERVQSSTEESLRLAVQMSLALWKAWGRIHSGWAFAERARPGGLAELEAGLDETRHLGAGRLESFHLGLAADAQSRAGRHESARSTIAVAFAAQERNPDMPFLPDLYRLRGLTALRVSAGNLDAAVADLRQAIKLARDQKARSLELRAARDLARLWAERGERQRAFDLLSPVFARFTEGFDTPDLRESKMLLEHLV